MSIFENHVKAERNVFILIVFTFIFASIGAIVEIFPLFVQEIAIEKVEGMRPSTPVELAGFEIYRREGCYGCHSQQIRALRDEVERYGHYSLAAESMYDYPFQWGSKRTGPDLARVGGKYSDDWHVEHLINPQSVVPESLMPRYKYLNDTPLNIDKIQARMKVMQYLGTPYTDVDINNFKEDIDIQLTKVEEPKKIDTFKKRYPNVFIRKFNKKTTTITEMDALVGYLQSLGNRADLSTNKGRDW